MSAENYTPSADDLRGNELQKPEVLGREAEIAAERVETGKTLQEMAKKVSRELVAAGVIGLNALVPFVGTAEAGAAELPKDGKPAVERVQERVFPGEIAPIKNGRIMTGQENYDYIYKATVVRRPLMIERSSAIYDANRFNGLDVESKYKQKKKGIMTMNDFTYLFEGKLMVAIQKPSNESQAKDKSKWVYQEKYDLKKMFNYPTNAKTGLTVRISRYDDYDEVTGVYQDKEGYVMRGYFYYKDGHMFKDWASLQGAQDLIRYPNLPVVRFDGPPRSKAEVVAIGRKLEAFRDEQLRGVDLKRVENEEAYKKLEKTIMQINEGVIYAYLTGPKATDRVIQYAAKQMNDELKAFYEMIREYK